MGTWAERACSALLVYFERGDRALKEFEEGRLAEGEGLLQLRKVAFHNFRAADHLARSEGYSEEQTARLQELWVDIQTSDRKLLTVLRSWRDQAESALTQVSKTRSTIARYRSGEAPNARFEETV